jgi:hypothetical protein
MVELKNIILVGQLCLNVKLKSKIDSSNIYRPNVKLKLISDCHSMWKFESCETVLWIYPFIV